MAQQIQLRRGTAAQWTAANPTLANGEMGLETDTAKMKIGTGSAAWNSLPYAAGGVGGGPGNTDALVEGATNLYFTPTRVRAAVLTGLSLASGLAVDAADTVLSAFGKLQNQVTSLVTAVAGKADVGHTHAGLAPAGGTTGQVLKKNSNTSHDYSWLADNGAVQNAMTPASTTMSPSVDAVVAALAAKADLLVPVFEVTTTGDLTKAGHTNREVTVTHTDPITRTFDFTGMNAGDSGVVFQGGAGAVTLAGATFSYAPGLTASPTTAGLGGSIQWTFLGSTNVRIDYRSQPAAATSNVKAYRQVGNVAAPLTSGESSDLMTLNVEPLSANGDLIRAYARWEAGNEASEQQTARLYLNGTLLVSVTLETNTRSAGFGHVTYIIERVSDTTVRVVGAFTSELNPMSATWNVVTVSSLSAGCSLSTRCFRSAAQTKTVSLLRLSATVERA